MAWPAAAKTINLRQLSTKQGLFNAFVMDMVQDHTGYLWLGTQDGLYRYNGLEFKLYDRSAGLPSSTVRVLLVDETGDLWVGTEQGLVRYHPEHDRFVAPGLQTDLAHAKVWSLSQDHRGRIWVGTTNDLFHFYPSQQNPVQVPLSDKPMPPVKAVFSDSRHQLWAITYGAGLFRKISEGWQPVPVEFDNQWAGQIGLTIAEIRPGELWLGTKAGLAVLDLDGQVLHSIQSESGLPGFAVRSLVQDSDGSVLIATEDGLTRMWPETQELTHVYSPDELIRPGRRTYIMKLLPDRQGNLWLGTHGKGVLQRSPTVNRFDHFTSTADGLPDNGIRGMVEDDQAITWILTQQSGLTRFDPATEDFQQVLPEFGGLTAVAAGSDNSLWLGNRYGSVFRYDTRQDKLQPLDLPGDHRINVGSSVAALRQTRDGSLWIATGWNGLFQVTPDYALRHYHQRSPNYALSSNSTIAMTEDGHGHLWIGTTDGVNRITVAGDVTHYGRAQGLPRSNYLAIHTDKRGVWAGSFDRGLFFKPHDAGQFKAVPAIPVDAIYGITGDTEGSVWISTSRGLWSLEPGSGEVQGFDTSDGLQDLEFNVYALFTARDGTIYAGGVNGFNRFRPQQFVQQEYPAATVFTGLRLFNRPVALNREDPDSPLARPLALSDHLTLSGEERRFSFEFLTLDLVQAHQTRYRYRLLGFDPDWIETDASNRLATYTDVPAGSYRFEVFGATGEGLWQAEPAVLQLTVLPPWWRSPLAYSLYACLFLAGVIILRGYRERRADRKRKLVESERRLKLALWGSDNGFWDWPLSSRTIYHSTGADNEQEGRQTSLNVIYRIMYPRDRIRVQEALGRYFAENQDTFEYPVRFRSREAGQWRWLLIRGRTVGWDGNGKPLRMAGTIRDITKGRAFEQQRKLLARSMHSTSDSVVILDPQYQVVEANPAFSRLTLSSTDRILATPFILAAREPARWQRIISTVNNDGNWRGAFELHLPTAENCYLDVTIDALRNSDKEISYYVVVMSDVTAQKRYEVQERILHTVSHEYRTPLHAILGFTRALQPTVHQPIARHYLRVVENNANHLLGLVNDQLDMAKINAGDMELEQQLLDLAELVTEVANSLARRCYEKGLQLLVDLDQHLPRQFIGDRQRLRQLLVNLLGNAIKFTPRGHVEIVVRYADAVQIVIRDTGIGIPEQERELIFQPFSQVNCEANRIQSGTGLGLAICRELADLMNGELSVCDNTPEGSCFVLTVSLPVVDSQPLVQDTTPLHMLIEDPREAAGYERVNHDIHWMTVHRNEPALLAAIRPGDNLLIHCADFSAETLEWLNYQIESAHQDGVASVSVSFPPHLSPPQEIEQQVDACCWMPLPVTWYSWARVRQQADQLALPTKANLSYLKALVVDDNPVNLELIQLWLSQRLCQVTTCHSGEEALDAVRGNTFDVILLDIQMPGIDGIETLKLLRDELNYTGPVIAITARAQQGERERLLNHGFDDFLPKPMTDHQLEQRLLAHCPADAATRPTTPETQSTPVDGDRLLQLFAVTVRETCDVIDDYRLALVREQTLCEALHKLQGGAAMMGHSRIAELCRSVQQAFSQQNREEAQRQLVALEQQLADLTSVSLVGM